MLKFNKVDFQFRGLEIIQQEVEMQFNCTLYNSNNDSLEIKNATFKTFLHYPNTI